MPVLTATDNFNRADASPTSGTWVTMFTLNNTQIVGNEVRPTVAGGGGNHSLWTPTSAIQQKSTVGVVTITGANDNARAVARGQLDVLTCYFCSAYGPFSATVGSLLEKYVTGTYSVIASGSTFSLATGGTISCDCNGATTIRMLANSVQIYSVTDTSIAEGRMGLGCFVQTTLANTEVDNWQGDYYAQETLMGQAVL